MRGRRIRRDCWGNAQRMLAKWGVPLGVLAGSGAMALAFDGKVWLVYRTGPVVECGDYFVFMHRVREGTVLFVEGGG